MNALAGLKSVGVPVVRSSEMFDLLATSVSFAPDVEPDVSSGGFSSVRSEDPRPGVGGVAVGKANREVCRARLFLGFFSFGGCETSRFEFPLMASSLDIEELARDRGVLFVDSLLELEPFGVDLRCLSISTLVAEVGADSESETAEGDQNGKQLGEGHRIARSVI